MATDGVRVSLGDPLKIVDIYWTSWQKLGRCQRRMLWIKKVWAQNIFDFLADILPFFVINFCVPHSTLRPVVAVEQWTNTFLDLDKYAQSAEVTQCKTVPAFGHLAFCNFKWTDFVGGMLRERQLSRCWCGCCYPLWPAEVTQCNTHTWYLLFLLHRQEFWSQNFTPKSA